MNVAQTDKILTLSSGKLSTAVCTSKLCVLSKDEDSNDLSNHRGKRDIMVLIHEAQCTRAVLVGLIL